MPCSKMHRWSDVSSMQTNLVKLATLITMFHMALGCAWHHGMGAAHGCQSDCHHSATARQSTDALPSQSDSFRSGMQHCCDHHLQAMDPVRINPVVAESTERTDESRFPQPVACHDDRCSFKESSRFDCDVLDGVTAHLSGAQSYDATAEPVFPTMVLRPVCHSNRLAPGLRVHLVFCVHLV